MKWILLFLISSNVFSNHNEKLLNKIKQLDSFAFGSCNREYLPQPLWTKIIQDKPQLFLWGGDNIYADKNPFKDQVQKKYIIQNSIPQYQKMKKIIPIIGIWDDHDFGKNNSGSEFKHKKLYQKYHLDFMQVPKDSPRRKQKGIYHTKTFGASPRITKFIMLDTRYFRTNKNLLGETQWSWLKREISNSTADLNFIVTGTPVTTPEIFRSEEWADFPKDKARLLNLLMKHKEKKVVILSGDKHFSAVIKKDHTNEIMCSGMTHSPFFLYHPVLNYLYEKPALEPNYCLINIDWESLILNVKLQMQSKSIKHQIKL